jgi:uncharacterized membrane protein
MQIDSATLVTIIGMALATYATRAGGLLIMRRVRIAGWVERWLHYVPGAVLVAIIAPAVAEGGMATLGAAVITALIAARSGSLLLAMMAGVGVVWLLRMWT